MATIHAIKTNIKQMGAGEFQNLCDSFLFEEGYWKEITSHGSQPGTKKTTKGTPDTYFRNNNGKYVLTEYTTQDDRLFAKIKDDIEKCLDKDYVKVAISEIEEIIYIHTSSRLNAEQDKELHDLCLPYGITLCLISIDTLAETLYQRYPRLVRDFLGLTIDTAQVQTVDDYVKQYNASILAAPLDIPFLFREKELKAISTAFESRDVVVLKGSAGNGKTRLALHFAKGYASEHGMMLYCIHDNGLKLFDDLRTYLVSPGKYFIVADDANELSELKHVLQYATDAIPDVTVKILVTVRDYAYKKIYRDIAGLVRCETVEVGTMTDEEITTLLKDNLGILNPLYHKRIISIARGNVRLAVLAGKLACASNDLQAIEDATQLYEYYYQSIMNALCDEDDKKLFICAGIIAFLKRMRIDHLDSYQNLLVLANISQIDFEAATHRLHRFEIINIFQDKAVVFADQCLGNYLIKYVFCDRKFINLQDVIEIGFTTFKEQTIQMINMLVSIFNNDALESQVIEAAKNVWKKLQQNDSPLFDDYVQSFYPINPTEALFLFKKRIDNMARVELSADQIDTETGKNDQTIEDPILPALGRLSYSEQGDIALDLFFEYYYKRPDLYMRFYQAFKRDLSINATAMAHEYRPQMLFFQKLRAYSDEWRRSSFTVLFWEVAKESLKFIYSPVESEEGNRLTVYHISLELSDSIKTYRNLIWESMLEVCAINEQEKYALELFRDYGSSIEKSSTPVMIYDQAHIVHVLDQLQLSKSLEVGLVAEHLIEIYDFQQIDRAMFDKYLQIDAMQLYQIVAGPGGYILHKHPEREQRHSEDLAKYALNMSYQDIEQLIELAVVLNSNDTRHYRFFHGLLVVFQNLALNSDLYKHAVVCYLRNNTPGRVYIGILIELLFKTMDAKLVWTLINEYDYDEKATWQYIYYHEVPDESITQAILDDLLAFYKSDLATKTRNTSFREILFLKKYTGLDPDIFVHVAEILLHNDAVNETCIHRYFSDVLSNATPHEFIGYFHSNIKILEDIYIKTSLFDGSNIDYNGAYLKELCCLDCEFLDTYLTQVLDRPSWMHHSSVSKCICLFELDNYIEIFDVIFDHMLELWKSHYLIESGLEDIIAPQNGKMWLIERQDIWIRHFITQNCRENEKMIMLFQVLASFENSRKTDYYLFFLEHNESFDDFEKLPLTPSHYGGIGGFIPLYTRWKEFASTLSPHLVGLRWLEHRRYLQGCIEQYQKMIDDEELQELLRG